MAQHRSSHRRPTRTPRIDDSRIDPDALKAVMGPETYVRQSGLDPKLLDLVKIRASQLNGCAYCIHMRTSEACRKGETEERLSLLDAWRESPLYSEREWA